MAQVAINKVTNANIYLEGGSLLGRASEIDLPSVTQKMAEHVALGMVGSFEFPSGVEAMEARISFNAIYGDTMATVSNPNAAVNLQCRSQVETYTSGGRTTQPCVVYLRGQFKSTGLGNFRQHDNVEIEAMMTVHYAKMEVGGEEILEFDTFANIYRSGGVDLLTDYRAAIGQ